MLEAIVESAQERAAGLDLAALVSVAEDAPQPRSLAAALSAPGLSVIAEIKRKSPSAGDIAPDLDAAARAAAYAAGGAAAISVLTEPHFFAGSLDDLSAVRRGVLLPVLRKDFIVAPAQVWESRAAAADAVLLIVAALDDGQLFDLIAVAADAGIDALVEVHDEAECERAIAAGAGIVGVNNRDLRTFLTDPAVAEHMAPYLASVPVTVAESGIGSGAVARRMEAAGYDAILVGEALVRASDPARLVAELAGEGATAP